MFSDSKVLSVFLLVSCCLSVSGVNGLWCDRTPAGVNVPKLPGDNGYKIVISGDPDKYIPEAVYTGKLSLSRKLSQNISSNFPLFIKVQKATKTDLNWAKDKAFIVYKMAKKLCLLWRGRPLTISEVFNKAFQVVVNATITVSVIPWH